MVTALIRLVTSRPSTPGLQVLVAVIVAVADVVDVGGGSWAAAAVAHASRLSARISLPDTGLYRINARADYGPK
ncbi:hypothetical protein [Streptomyces sp. NPDC058297]|uniref:hypothetical protein n=1 Tax=Streptomyces sp. NPDC058297 TaxID=3346433 RepID=UPI0036E83ED8